MASAFKSGADFSKMSPTNDLNISEVFHKAFIEVDEKGTGAAAATAVVMMTTSCAPEKKDLPIIFNANHPFLFYIVDDETKAILFMGRMMEPVAE
ncbi:MAG: Serpin (serine protease inhibitor) [Bacteroidetes bacterium ADurb.Bin408]|nr:MAG: Serpin (serine protease inhibitor) [Bacteroidetes bacterium ADurb.Bin408]